MRRCPDYREPDFPVYPGFARLINGVVSSGGGYDVDAMRAMAKNIKDRHEGKILNARSAASFLAPKDIQ